MAKVKHFLEFFGREGEEGPRPQVEIMAREEKTITIRRETLYVGIIFFVAVAVGAFILGRMTAPKTTPATGNYGFACGTWPDMKKAQEALTLLKSSGVGNVRLGRVTSGYCVVVRGFSDKETAKKAAQQALKILTTRWPKGLRSWIIGAD